MIRTFHPIGQGAFYSETHDEANFNMVFDCGEWKGAHRVDEMIAGSFPAGETIGCLFISHFDYDHVSKIDILKSAFPIERVVLPLLHDQERLLLSNIHTALGQDNVARLIRDPATFFGDNTRVVPVEAANPEAPPARADVVSLDAVSASNILSGTVLEWRGTGWVYVPYNHEYSTRMQNLQNELARAGIDASRVCASDVDYLIRNRTKIKAVYNSLQGRINQNSLMLYSGPKDASIRTSRQLSFHNGLSCSNWHGRDRFFEATVNNASANRTACVYCGDCDFHKTKLQQVFQKQWNQVGTIQIPHHGDHRSFDSAVIAGGSFLCPISVGNGNNYGHPSPEVLSKILKSGSHPILVTDNCDSIFFDVIEYSSPTLA